MRWLYHIVRADERIDANARYAPASLAAEGFLHASYRDAVAESARLYFPAGIALAVLPIDPRRLDVSVEEAATPRGPMPHIRGPVPADAIGAPLDVAAIRAAPDVVTGTSFGFVAFDQMTLLDLVSVLDPIARIASMGFDPTSRREVISADAARVWAADGAEFTTARVRPPLDEFDVLVVAGGIGTRRLQHDAAVIAWLSSFPRNRIAASVCTGALLLGAAGRLRGKRATTHASALGELAEYGATVVRERVVDDGQVVTAGGVTSGIDLGLHLVQRLVGLDARERIAAQIEYCVR